MDKKEKFLFKEMIEIINELNIPWVIRGNILTLLGEQQFIEIYLGKVNFPSVKTETKHNLCLQGVDRGDYLQENDMKTEYYALLAQSNLKGDDDQYRYYIEPVDGGGIVAKTDTESEAHKWCKDNNGILKFII